MKNKAFLGTLIFLLIAVSSRAEVITGTSDPFQFGSPPVMVSLSILALALSGGLILYYTIKRRRGVESK